MSNYSQIVLYGPKDSLTHGDPNKAVKGAQLDGEFSAIASAVATKIDSTFSSPTVTNLSVSTGNIPTNGMYLALPNTLGLAANSVYRASFASSGAIIANATGTTSFSGSILNPALSLSGGAVTSLQGQTTGIPETTPATLFTLPNNPSITTMYFVCATSAGTADVGHYAATSCVVVNTASSNISTILNVPSFFTLSISGLSVRVSMSTGGGGGYTVQWSYLRIM